MNYSFLFVDTVLEGDGVDIEKAKTSEFHDYLLRTVMSHGFIIISLLDVRDNIS